MERKMAIIQSHRKGEMSYCEATDLHHLPKIGICSTQSD